MRTDNGTRQLVSGGWMFWPDGDRPGHDWRDRIVALPTPSAPTKADPDVRHRVYSRLLDLLSLSTHHRDHLRARGFSDVQIDLIRFKSLPGPGRAAVAGELVTQFGTGIIGNVPGLYVRRDRYGELYATLAGSVGILVPIRDPSDRIAGFQIRRDNADDGSGKYHWFSSIDREGGCGSGAPILTTKRFDDIEISTSIAVITEGGLKAYLGAQLLTSYVVALAGVSAQSGAVEALRAIGATEVAIAFDQDEDPKVRERITRDRDRLATTCAAAGITPYLVSWEGSAKGLDDALVAGVVPTFVPYPLKRRSGDTEILTPEATPSIPPRPLRLLSEIRSRQQAAIEGLIARRDPGFFAFSSGTGTGKTVAAARALVHLHQINQWPRVEPTTKRKNARGPREARVLYAAQTKEMADVFALEANRLAMVMEGRNPQPDHGWGCHRHDQIELVGGHRHNPMVDVCVDCKDQHELVHGRSWNCNYLQSKELAEKRRLVAAPYPSVFNGSSELRNYDVIIADESILPALVETVVLTEEHAAEWIGRMNQLVTYGIDDAYRRFTSALMIVIERGRDLGQDWLPALPALLEVCPDLPEIVLEMIDRAPVEIDEKTDRYAFETPRLHGPNKEAPLRLMQDLVVAVATELDRPEGADTRLWLTPAGLKLFMVRQHLVDILRKKTVINLDATPSPLLKYLFPDIKEIKLEAAAPMVVTQVVDTLATRHQLTGTDNLRRDRIAVALEAITANAIAPTIFTFKGLDPNVAGDGPRLTVSNPGAQYGHFDCETRGLNRFQDSDLIAIVGRYSAPVNELRALAQGLRFAQSPPSSSVDARDSEGRPLRLRPYLWSAHDGTGRGRWSAADEDPDVDELIRWSEASTIIQAIGRGRAVLRDESNPLQVYLFTSAPIAGLAIDHLVTLNDLGAPPPRRKVMPQFFTARDEYNDARRDEARAKVMSALSAMRAEGLTITFSALAKRAGVSKAKLLGNPTLRTLVRQEMGSNEITDPVPTGSCHINNRHHPVGTTQVIPTDAPADEITTRLVAVKDALVAADHASRDELPQAANELADRLAAIARARGRSPDPKPSDQHTTYPIKRELA